MNEITKAPILALSIKPDEKLLLPAFFSGEDNEFYQLLKSPPHLRYMGWNMLTLDQPKIFKGQGWEVNNGDRKKIRLYSDGSLIAVVDAGKDFLGWSTTDKPEINATALIEFCYEFISFYSVVLSKLKEDKTVKFKITFIIKNAINSKREKLFLIPFELNSLGYLFNKSSHDTNWGYIHSSTVKDQFIVNSDEFTKPEKLTVKLLEYIFKHFGIALEDIPYMAIDDNHQIFLDVKQIVDL